MIRYTFTLVAAADLEGIWDFIAEDSVTAADAVIEDIRSAVEALADMPGMGHSRDDPSRLNPSPPSRRFTQRSGPGSTRHTASAPRGLHSAAKSANRSRKPLTTRTISMGRCIGR